MAVLIRILTAGLISGLALGFFLKAVEANGGPLVYTLLLNVDFIPMIGSVKWPEWIEFFFHLIVSFFLAAGFYFLCSKGKKPFSAAFLVTTPAIFLYFPLAALAQKPVPSLTDLEAILWWTAGHALYAAVLGAFGLPWAKKNAQRHNQKIKQ